MKIKIDKELFQWEQDREVFVIKEQDEPTPSFVQFYNKKTPKAPILKLENGRAKIPNRLLQDAIPITVLVCTGENIDSCLVIDRREFRVLKRAKPDQYADLDGFEVIFDGGEEK